MLEWIWWDSSGAETQPGYSCLPLPRQPGGIRAFIADNYPGRTIRLVEVEEDDDEPYKYGVTLCNGIVLYFDASGNLVDVDDD